MAMSEARIWIMSHPKQFAVLGAVLGAIGFDGLLLTHHGDVWVEALHYVCGAGIGAGIAGGVAWYLIRDEERLMQKALRKGVPSETE